MALLELSGVTHTYDSANNSWWKSKQKLQGAVVKDISMTLEAGQCIGLLGGERCRQEYTRQNHAWLAAPSTGLSTY
ncbi:hypothetical protein [Paenibacillus polymyxa]|uniref:hypothetical protein n=1 Tax=Paenibacillus polymyxa TaxID=1406 RepID=UPI001E31EC1E|nr:hypothetical protein [Paenibacillus polymyxa]